ncbi:MAG: 30S ribosomal protein S17e [Candidatus Aenigmatarchaeota archaeon]
MGRIRTKDIKHIAEKILEEHKDKFTDNFEKNKQIISQLYNFQSKKLKNKIVGYLTSLVSKQKTQ